MIKFRKDEEQKEEYQDTIFKQCQYLNTPLQYGEFLETWDLFIFCIKYYNGWYAWYLVFLWFKNSYYMHFTKNVG